MISTIEHNGKQFRADLSSAIDISLPLKEEHQPHVSAFYLPDVKYQAAEAGTFVGSVQRGGSCNVNNIFFSPHGNGTHTECIGHITKEKYSINDCLKEFFFVALLVSIAPEQNGSDKMVTREQLLKQIGNQKPEALIIRTLPNDEGKKAKNYSGTNPPYIQQEAAALVCELGIKQLLIDLPSMDKEDDGGKLLAHRAFWNYPASPRINSTITELIYVPSSVADGLYFLNLQVASFDNDASPSRPVLFLLR
jgi:kynurenine formamidase